MKVEKKGEQAKYEDVGYGAVFVSDGIAYISMPDVEYGGKLANAWDIESDEFAFIDEDETGTVVDAKLVIE